MNSWPVKKFCFLLLALLAVSSLGQQSGQSVPDAPSAVKKPPEQAPAPAPPPRPAPRASEPESRDPLDVPNLTPRKGVPAAATGNAPDQVSKLTVNVNFVVVPVTVKDERGNLVYGLEQRDFSVYENDVPQRVQLFSNEPFPLSAAVVIDTDLPSGVLSKVQQTLPALVGAFGQFDEVAVFAFGGTVKKVQDFSLATAKEVDSTIASLKEMSGSGSGVPFAGGPFNSPPTINGKPVNPATPPVEAQTVPSHSKVLNDAMLAAAQEVARRSSKNRRMIFVISDGREKGSASSSAEVLRVLLSHNITVYAVEVGDAALPGYGRLQRIPLPKLGPANILPKYVSASGGTAFSELNEHAIETAYSEVTQEARNQYTLGYTTHATASTSYRDIEVRVHRPSCDTSPGPNCVRVYAKDGYYPLPPSRQ